MNYLKKNRFFYNINQECSYIINGDDLFISTERGLFIYSLKNDKLETLINKKIYWFSILKKQVIYQLENGGDLFGLWNNNKKEGKYYLSSSILFDDNALILDKKNENTKLYETILLYQDLSVKTINLTYFPDKIIDNNTYTYIALNTLFIYTFNNELLWQHSFSDLFETEQGAEFIFQNGNIIIHNGKLFFSLFENNRHYNTATFAIEIETGKVVNMYKGFAGNLTLFNNKIAVAVNEELRILNLDNNEITTRTFSFLKEKNITIGWNDFQISEDEKLYFIGNDHKQGTHFGIIDLQKDELLWLHSPNKNDKTCKVSIRDFKISDNRVFLHYSDNTLHIFEEEK